jgi:predicted amidohydrolase
VSICYDVRFPDVYGELQEAGVERLFVPAAFPRVRIEDWKRLLVERAQETGLPVIGINSVGDDGENEFGGSTMVVDADGRVLAQADETSEQILEVTI